ncbi:hypothetical protein V1522DRAFT_414538 [Lipomyces starkeyi]
MLTASPENHSSAKVAQVLTQKTHTVYGRDYVSHCSSIGTVDELRGEEEDTTHIDNFQRYGQFHDQVCRAECLRQRTKW